MMIIEMGLRVHIMGASGSGTSTLGHSLAEAVGATHLDTDTHYWAPSRVPFTRKRAIPERISLLGAALDRSTDWVLSGSLCGWGDVFIPRFTHVVFLYVPWPVRRDRLVARERQRHGEALNPGGAMHEVHTAFLGWASRYDEAGLEQRSYATHERWLADLPSGCKVLRIEEESDVHTLTQHIQRWVESGT